MARFTDPVCKRCRREGMKLHLKGNRCYTPKCPMERENPPCNRPPGMHGARKGKLSEYGLRLREKQKLKWFYGVLERQFRRYYAVAARSPENTGEQLLSVLERRLDNIVHRLGFAPSRNAARQMVTHGHVLLNGKKCTIPSLLLRPGDVVAVKSRQISLQVVRAYMAEPSQQPIPDFLEIIPGDIPEGRLIRVPSRGDVDPRIADIREQLIIEIATR
jgi:small subunit ribosomal protein S4